MALHYSGMDSGLNLSSGDVPQGLLPVEISERYAIVRWMRLSGEELTGPFFPLAVDRLRRRNPAPMEFETDLSTLAGVQARLAPVNPRAIIFHMSRCGSTLVLNALRAAGSQVVAPGEPQPLERAMMMAGAALGSCASSGRDILVSLVTLLSHYQGGPARDVILKPGINGIISLPSIRAIWPGVVCIILVRDPVEVLISNVEKQPRWILDSSRHPDRNGKPPREVTDAGLEGVGAWVIGGFCAEVLRRIDEHCIVVDYEDLSPEMLRVLAARCEIPVCADHECRIADVFKADAKNPAKQYLDDREGKNSRATDSMRRCVANWALEPYLQLRNQRLRV